MSLIESLETNPKQGVQIFKNCFKIRIAIKSKGKSGGARVITHFAITDNTVFLLSVITLPSMDFQGTKNCIGAVKDP